MYRPETVISSPKRSLSGRVEWIEYLGSIQRITFEWNGQNRIYKENWYDLFLHGENWNNDTSD